MLKLIIMYVATNNKLSVYLQLNDSPCPFPVYITYTLAPPPLPHPLTKSTAPGPSSRERIQNSGFLGGDCASVCKWLLTFRRHVMPSLSGITHPTPHVTSQKTTMSSYIADRTPRLARIDCKNATLSQTVPTFDFLYLLTAE